MNIGRNDNIYLSLNNDLQTPSVIMSDTESVVANPKKKKNDETESSEAFSGVSVEESDSNQGGCETNSQKSI